MCVRDGYRTGFICQTLNKFILRIHKSKNVKLFLDNARRREEIAKVTIIRRYHCKSKQ